MKELADLRERLRVALSGASKKGELTTAALAEQIRTLRAGQTVEAAPQRTGQRQFSAEEPVTARIRRRSADTREKQEVFAEPDTAHRERIRREGRSANGR